MAQHNTLGFEGEQAAAEFIIKQGWTVRERNWKMGNLEIDIVAETPGRLHIVEVKTRTHDDKFDPMKAVGPAKQRHLINAANGYINYYHLKMEIQYDVVIVANPAVSRSSSSPTLSTPACAPTGNPQSPAREIPPG